MMLMLTMVLMMIMFTLVPDVYAANYDHANNYAYDYAEHDDHSVENYAETHCKFNYVMIIMLKITLKHIFLQFVIQTPSSDIMAQA